VTAPQPIGDLLRAHARARPDAAFLWCGEQRQTYAEADERSDRVAAGLAELGIERGDRVAVLAANRIEVLELFFGGAKAGAIQVPLNAFLKGEFLRYQLDDSQATTFVCDAAGFDAARPLLDRLPELRRIVCFDAVSSEALTVEVIPFDRVRSSNGPVPTPALGAADIVDVLYTSGTTGLPKGCILQHGYYTHVGRVMAEELLPATPDDSMLMAQPLYHVGSRMTGLLWALHAGAEFVIEPEFSARAYVPRLVETQVTYTIGVGAIGTAVMAQPPSDLERAHSLRAALWMPFSVELQEAFEERFGVPCTQEIFAQTECLPACYSPISGPRNRRSTGRPAPYLDLKLVDDDDLEVPVGEIGEIVIRPLVPYAMFQGYWRKPEATLEAFRNLWHHTGDYGRADEDGFIAFVDRKKDALRRRGENVSSVELEAAILGHPAIAETAVHAVPSEMIEDDIKACVVLAPGAEVTPEGLFSFFKEAIPYFAIPRYVEVMPALPRNAVGRVMKHVLRDHGITPETWDLECLGLTVARGERRSGAHQPAPGPAAKS
jgi:crotonobetaine/carnitine-CoA ligase